MERMLFENSFYEKKSIVEAEPSHGGTETGDISKSSVKAGFSKSTLSRTLPALVGYVQPLNSPTGYIFGFRPKKSSGSDPHEIQTISTEPDGSIVKNPISHDTLEDFMIARKEVTASLREVKIDMTTSVEQDVLSLFGGHFEEDYHTFLDPTTEGKVEKVARFFFEYCATQMVKKTNKAFTDYLGTIASNLGTATLTVADSDKQIPFILGEMQSSLMGKRSKVAGRFWIICSPAVAALISSYGDIFHGEEAHLHSPSSTENTFVTTMGNMDIYMSPDVEAGTIYMGVLGNANVSSIYYNPYNEYMINGGADVRTGINNIFFRVRDAWSTNPVDTFGDTQPTAGTNIDVVESAASDFVVSAVVTVPTLLS